MGASQGLIMKKIDLNQVVYTTTNIMKQTENIVIIYHDTEDDWQFFGTTVSEENIALISFKQMLEINPNISEFLDLPKGYKYEWDQNQNKWIKSLDRD